MTSISIEFSRLLWVGFRDQTNRMKYWPFCRREQITHLKTLWFSSSLTCRAAQSWLPLLRDPKSLNCIGSGRLEASSSHIMAKLKKWLEEKEKRTVRLRLFAPALTFVFGLDGWDQLSPLYPDGRSIPFRVRAVLIEGVALFGLQIFKLFSNSEVHFAISRV